MTSHSDQIQGHQDPFLVAHSSNPKPSNNNNNMANTADKFIIQEVFNFKLFFGKYKGQFLSNTPMSYRTWLIQSDFYKGLTIKFPVKVKKRNGDGDTWWDFEMVKVEVPNPDWDPDLSSTSYHTEDPEERHWKNLATWNERHCDPSDWD